MISRSSRKQTFVALSMTDVEYIVACSAYCEVVWHRKLFIGLFDKLLESITIYCDNQSCLKLLENSVFHDRLKHIEIKYHYIQNIVTRGAVRLKCILTNAQLVDVLTKPLF